MTRSISMFLLIVGVWSAANVSAIQIEIQAGDHDRDETPVQIPLPDGEKASHYLVGDALVAAVEEDGKRSLNLLVTLNAGKVLALNAKPMDHSKSRVDVKTLMQCIVDDKHITVTRGDRRMLQYSRAIVTPPKGAKPSHARSGFIHPVLTPAGRVVTNAFAEKHWHHYGLWFPWRKTEFEGQEVNFWETGGGQGTVRHAKLNGHGNDRYSAWFDVAQEHVALRLKGGPKTVLNETWRVQAYATKDHHLFDIRSAQSTASQSPLAIKKYYYGGFGMRGSAQWEGDAVAFLTSEGKTRKDGNFTAARWTSMSGKLDGQPAGITIMSHPTNFRHPQKTRLHPKEPFFCYAPGMDEPFTIKPGQRYVSQYRFIVHDGEVDAKKMERLWHDYASPPRVVVKK